MKRFWHFLRRPAEKAHLKRKRESLRSCGVLFGSCQGIGEPCAPLTLYIGVWHYVSSCVASQSHFGIWSNLKMWYFTTSKKCKMQLNSKYHYGKSKTFHSTIGGKKPPRRHLEREIKLADGRYTAENLSAVMFSGAVILARDVIMTVSF